ncbi:unnamed protein product [Fusarium graminearum]|uniref:Chromosome 1, complete genome n=2 Tax=Gibberella zeae TaxID=5518 RepID=I1RCP0_GIBZE|nr:hypothetical protein FGSG_01363 [Fusarium graminearum PH-1]EYB22511.1 hypothetical protein FG05_01363 [Fusarium graminearum]ESU06672.1 hypothetical protein FGSG_01363 [Fusarium graminearum PH-1]KAI6759144.1 hypothetical protein HG531_013905 [Fusarium graminearum]PCD22829.1 hypothetical protein FGRA07_04199 [Fusarium graminearum]CAF3575125.1 unnamed protein product [Fusarium graminearum]|eukprot:XP_011317157.1 hypothetical protein FGSG_01363 [Fusarium graminearum PH-1]
MAKIGPSPENAGNHQPSTLYSLVMTPINITVFLLSLLLVDFRHTAGRNNFYATGSEQARWMPRWLLQPYQHIGHSDHDAHGRWHYHSKQKKLMKMEAEEAFQMRSTVLVFMAVALALATSAVWLATSSLYYGVTALVEHQSNNQTTPLLSRV